MRDGKTMQICRYGIHNIKMTLLILKCTEVTGRKQYGALGPKDKNLGLTLT